MHCGHMCYPNFVCGMLLVRIDVEHRHPVRIGNPAEKFLTLFDAYCGDYVYVVAC
jgi:hypothetical protein